MAATIGVPLYACGGGTIPLLQAWLANGMTLGSATAFMITRPATTFSPDETMTHAMLLTVLYRHAGSPATEGTEDLADETSISSFAREAVDRVRGSGIIDGVGDDRFAPQGITTRAQTVTVLYCFLVGRDDLQAPAGDKPVVYMTTDISSNSLMAIYEALDWTPSGKVAVKLSTGEPGSNYLRTDLIGPLVRSLDHPTIVECNTAYGGSRANTAMHYQVAEDHGYTAIADVDIMDENGSMTLPVTGGENLTENYVGANFANYDSFLILSHFKGHAMAGFGGAIKNISIGIASAEGKCWIHSGGASRTNAWGGEQDAFLESMAEAGKAVADALAGNASPHCTTTPLPMICTTPCRWNWFLRILIELKKSAIRPKR